MMGTNQENFEYETLNHTIPEIRVVHLLPGVPSEDVRCLLQHITHPPHTAYTALSYVWGDSNITRPISLLHHSKYDTKSDAINDFHQFQVTTNLERALRHLRRETNTVILWIDAICIDQNNLRERESEVKRMGSIYATASSVAVWLGLYHEESDPAPLTEPPYEDSIRESFGYMKYLADQLRERNLYWSKAPVEDQSLHPNRLAMRGLYSIYNRRWFERLWVLQEVILAKGPVIALCGNYSIDFAFVIRSGKYIWELFRHLANVELSLLIVKPSQFSWTHTAFMSPSV